jgi:mono/diheme cytochrome c family protein
MERIRKVPNKLRALPAATALVLAFFVGCRHIAPEIAAPPVATLGGSSVGADRLEAGRAVYLGETKCVRCHHPKAVNDYAAEKWTTNILPRMAKKSKLTPQEYDDVQAYVLAAAKPAQR